MKTLLNAMSAGIIAAGGAFVVGATSQTPSPYLPHICVAAFLVSTAKDYRSLMKLPPVSEK